MHKWKLSFTAATVLAVLALVIALLAASAYAAGLSDGTGLTYRF